MSIMERIRAHGGEVTRDGWRFKVRRGRLTAEAMAWVRAHKIELMREVWPEFDRWDERAAIKEFDGGMNRDEAEASAYAEVSSC